MKTLIIILALLISTPIYSTEVVPGEQTAAPTKRQFESKKSNPTADLKNQIVQLELELRNTKRKYYAEKTENKKLREASTTGEEHTEEQIAQDIQDAENNIYYGGLLYSISERKFLLSLATKEDITWLLEKMHSADLGRLQNLIGETDESYLQDVEDIVADYKSYYDVNRNKQEQAPAQEAQQE